MRWANSRQRSLGLCLARRLRCLAIGCILLLPPGISAALIVVRSDPWGDFGEAIGAAQAGDVLYLLPGTHRARDARLLDNLRIVGDGPTSTVIQCEYNWASGFLAEHITGALIEGVSIYGGRGHQTYPEDTPKGGALFSSGSEVTIRNCVIARCDVRDGEYHGLGGAICAEYGSRLTIEDCVFRDNAAEYGGAIYLTPMEWNSTLSQACWLAMRRCLLESNYAGRYGGALHLSGPGAMVIEDCSFIGNLADWGGALHRSGGPLELRNCRLLCNAASWGRGGALTLSGGPFSLSNCVLANNLVRDGNTNGSIDGAAISCSTGSLRLTNCTIAGNRVLELQDEDLMRQAGGVYLDDVSAEIANCIFRGNTEDIGFTSKARVDVRYCNIEDMFPGEGVTHLNPRFVDPENGDFRLLGDSPCIDRGSDDPVILSHTDIEGKPRLLFGGVAERPDLGAYEYDPATPLRICTESLRNPFADREYRVQLKATGGFGPYSWFPLSGNLPLGMELSGDGVLSGTPAIPGTYDFTVLVATLQGQSQQRSYQLEVSGYRNWYVDAGAGTLGDGSSPGSAFSTIQEAVDAASEGDMVHVAPGNYTGPIAVHVPIDLLGPGADKATIDGQQGGSVVSFWLLPFGKISGFTITNGLSDKGGGLFLYESGIEITDCVVESNSANYLGGGIYANLSPAKIRDCIVRGNVSGLGTYFAIQAGGGIYSYFSPLEIDRCIVENNGVIQAGYPYWGGGLSLQGSHPVVTNTLVARNYLDSPSAYKLGAGIFALFGSPIFVNCTIADNYVEDTGFVYRVGGLGAADCWATVRNCILWGNGIDLVDARAEYSVVGTPPKWTEGPGNINVDPQFVDPASSDYRLKDTSPCIDAAFNRYIGGCDTDLDGQPRVLNGLVDMGAYENPRHEFGRLVIEKESDAITLTWNSHPGETYTIESSEDLIHWFVLGIQPSGGLYTSWLRPANFPSPTFFRISKP